MTPVRKYSGYSLAQTWLLLFLLFIIVTINDARGQQTITQMRESMLEQVYYKQFEPRNILSGKFSTSNYDHIGGHPFFFDYYESEGYFIYDGIQYNDLPFQYDIYNQAILIKTHDKKNGTATISIDTYKVSEFKSGDVKFVRYKSETLPESIYQVAYHGTRSLLLIKRSKEVKKLTQNVHGKLRMFVTKNRYFLVINKNTIEIKNKKDLFKIFENDESLINYAKKLRIGSKKDGFEQKLISTLAYYDEL